jgi:hypothetical protein
MAEIYQNPSSFQNTYPLDVPRTLIPEAPRVASALSISADPDRLLQFLINQLPKEQQDSVLLSVLLGQKTREDTIRDLTAQGLNLPYEPPGDFQIGPAQNNPFYRQGSQDYLQGGISQPGLTPNSTLPNTPPSQYATTTQPTATIASPTVSNTTAPANSGYFNWTRTAAPVFSYSNPFYSSVTSPVLNEQGQEVGQTNLANNQFATPGMANSLLNYLGSTYGLNNGRVVEGQYSGPTRPSQSELGIQFGNSPVINAGLEYQRLQNTNNYSRPYLDAQFKDTLQPGSSGWSNYANGGQSINSAQAERLYAGNPNTDPNVNPMGQAWKSAQTNGSYSGPQTQNNMGGPSALPNSNNSWRSLPGNTTISGYAGAQNQRAANFNNPMNFRGNGRF